MQRVYSNRDQRPHSDSAPQPSTDAQSAARLASTSGTAQSAGSIGTAMVRRKKVTAAQLFDQMRYALGGLSILIPLFSTCAFSPADDRSAACVIRDRPRFVGRLVGMLAPPRVVGSDRHTVADAGDAAAGAGGGRVRTGASCRRPGHPPVRVMIRPTRRRTTRLQVRGRRRCIRDHIWNAFRSCMPL